VVTRLPTWDEYASLPHNCGAHSRCPDERYAGTGQGRFHFAGYRKRRLLGPHRRRVHFSASRLQFIRRTGAKQEELVAQQILVSLVDDLDGSEADETVQFALDGVTYEIDLSAENAEELRDALAQYIEHARRSGGRKRTSSRRRAGGQAPARSSSAEREQNQAIRAWARKNGYEISDRGRIPSEVAEAYRKAH